MRIATSLVKILLILSTQPWVLDIEGMLEYVAIFVSFVYGFYDNLVLK